MKPIYAIIFCLFINIVISLDLFRNSYCYYKFNPCDYVIKAEDNDIKIECKNIEDIKNKPSNTARIVIIVLLFIIVFIWSIILFLGSDLMVSQKILLGSVFVLNMASNILTFIVYNNCFVQEENNECVANKEGDSIVGFTANCTYKVDDVLGYYNMLISLGVFLTIIIIIFFLNMFIIYE
jgi:hypothetical protein